MSRLICLAVLPLMVLTGLVDARAACEAVAESDPDILADYAAISAGVSLTDLGSGPAPGVLVVHGRKAFPVVLDEGEQVFVAASRHGAGRAAAFSHGAYMSEGNLAGASDLGTLMQNFVRWAGDDAAPVVGVEPGLDGLASYLTDSGFDVRRVGPDELMGIDVFCVSAQTGYTEAQLDGVRDWTAAGGGLLTSGTPWAFSYEDFALNFPGNRMLCGSGLTFNEHYTWPSAGEDVVSADAPCPLLNGTRAADALRDHVDGIETLTLADQSQASRSVREAMARLLRDCTEFWTAVDDLMTRIGPVFPTEADPVFPDDEPIDALRVSYDDVQNQTLPAAEIVAHPAGDDFPGAVPPSAVPVARTLSFDGDHAGLPAQRLYANARSSGWRSTGLYAAPGALIAVDVPAELTDAGLRLLIGCHTDNLLGKDEWVRSPRVTRSFPLDTVDSEAANAFGGSIYVQVPTGSTLGTFELTISGGIEAPLHVFGETSVEDWVATTRDHPAPWAELASDRFIMTVPSADIRGLDDPNRVMELWNAILDDQAELAAIPVQRPRAERFVFDRQISAGWMHSGYPIMAHLASVPELTEVDGIFANGSWGPLHELGHDHQWRDWVIPGTTESSCNLFTIHGHENVLGISREDAHPAVEAGAREQRLNDYMAAGADFGSWSAWIGLEHYLHLEEGFGWQAYIDVFGEYLDIPEPERPTNDQERIDQWLVRSSGTVNRDLRPFFDCWGIPTTEPSRSRLEGLPTWERDPMRRYCPADTASLVINRSFSLDAMLPSPRLDEIMTPACSTLPHRTCPEEEVQGALDGMRLVDEAAFSGVSGLWLYEHSGGLTDMKVSRDGNDLVFAVPE